MGILVLLTFVTLLPEASLAQGGPPFLTDDPGTPGPGNWEINIAAPTERHATEREFEIPILDFNYGVGERIQLNYQVSYLLHGSDSDLTRSGLSNSQFAVKWRFFEDKKRELALSTYPRIEFNNPTNSVQRDLAGDGTSFLLPIEVTKKIGPVDVNGEGGYWFRQYGPNAWISGLAIGHQFNRLELIGEVYGTGATDGSDQATTFDIGGRYRLAKPLLILFMAGRSFLGPASGQPQFFGYLGLQFQIERHREKEESRPDRSTVEKNEFLPLTPAGDGSHRLRYGQVVPLR